MNNRKWTIAGLCLVALTATACGTTTEGSSSSNGSGTSTSTCATGNNDVYVVENAACTAGAGKLSRINPDAGCKEEKLTGLNCPVDFVLSTVDSGIGYLSSRTDGILQVDVNAKTTTQIVTTTNIVSPAGLALLESITDDEREGPCGGNTLVDAILLIADEGTELDGGMIWRWCLITDDATVLSGGTNPSPVSEVPPSQVKHPRGVAVKNRVDVFITGHNPDIDDTTQSAILAYRELNANEAGFVTFLTDAGDFSGDIKDIVLDSDGTFLIADPGNNAIFRYDHTARSLTSLPGFSDGPRDVLPIGTNGDGNLEYLVSEFDGNVISRTTFITGSEITSATTGITLSGPDGLAQ